MGYDAMDATHLKSIHKRFGSSKLKNFPVVNFTNLYFKYPFIHKMKTRYPLNLISYNKQEAIKTLEEKFVEILWWQTL